MSLKRGAVDGGWLAGLTGLTGLAGRAGPEEPIWRGDRSTGFAGWRSELIAGWTTVLSEEEVPVDGRWAAGFTGGRSERAGFAFGSGLTGERLEEPATGLTRLTGGSGLIERDEAELRLEGLAAHLRGVGVAGREGLAGGAGPEEPFGWGDRSTGFAGWGSELIAGWASVLSEEEVPVDCWWAAGFTGGRSERAGFSFGSGLTGERLEEPATGLAGLAGLTWLTGGSGLIERDKTELSREVVS